MNNLKSSHMKAIYQLKKYLLFLLSIICFQYSYASHSMGGYINYRCIDSVIGRYEITLHLFRDCSGIQFGTEQIQIISSTLNTTVTLTKISGKEVTPLCQVPDVTVRAITNCPHAPIGSIQGIEKHVFRAYVTLGRNKGWAIVGWGTCCRLNAISNIQSPASAYWIQAAINTNYINSSPIVNSEATNYLWQNKENWIDFSAKDSFDSQYIIVGGRHIIRDSLVYEFYTPNTALGANPNSAVLLMNPSVVFNQGLSANQFIRSSPPINFDKKSGIANIRPIIVSHAVAAVVVKEYRAIPSSNGNTYSREYIGHTCRDQVFITRTSGTEINSEGVVADSSNVEIIVNPHQVRTCRAKGNKIVMKFSTASGIALKLKDVSVINSQEISNYSFKTTSKQVGSQLVAHAEFKFDRNFATLGYEFKIKAYYCNSDGISVENYIPLSVLFSNATIGFETDTLIFCANSGTVPLSLPLAKKVNWKSNDAILSAANLDSNLVNILPQNSHWIYATNLKHSELCRVNDSIYVKVETCNQVKGNIYHDVNNNCSNDASLDIPAKIPINLKGKTSSYNQTIYPDNSGNYSFSPPAFNNYVLTVNNVIVNCNPKINTFDVYLADSPAIVNIAVKDSPSFVGYPSTPKTLNYCVGETANVEFVLPFMKTMGYVKARMEYGNGVFEERVLGIEPMQTHLVFNRTYNANGVFPASIKILSYADKIIYQTPMNTISIGSCLHAKFFIDMNDDCKLDTDDLPISGSSIDLTDVSSNQKQNSYTNVDGIVTFYVKNGIQYNLSNANIIGCNQNKKDITFNFPNLDTSYQLNVPLDKNKIIPSVSSTIVIKETHKEFCVNSQRSFVVKVSKSTGVLSMKLVYNDGAVFNQVLPFAEGVYEYNYSHTFLNKTIGHVNIEFLNLANKIHEITSDDFIQLLCTNESVFNDRNNNCVDEMEPKLKYIYFKLTNLFSNKFTYVYTNNLGKLNLSLNNGQNYRLESLKFPICGTLYSFDFTADTSKNKNLNLPINYKNNYVARIGLEPRTVPNNTADFILSLDALSDVNNFPNDLEANTFSFELTLPEKCIYKSVTNEITMTHLGGNTYLFEGPRSIVPKVTVEFRNLVITDNLCFFLRLRGIHGERDTIDNQHRICRRALVAYDPNNKIPAIRSSINTEDFIDKTNPITYTINFQNEGKAPARDVYILDQLSSKLNWESMEIKHASHPMSVSLSNTGQLRFDFKDIILPEKDADEEGSKGHVIFSIKPNSDLEIGDVIRNTAEIYFDANEAVITNTAISRLVKPTGPYDFFNVSISTHPQNAGITSGQGRYIFDDQVRAEAIAMPGYQFNYWTDNGVVKGPSSNYFFAANKDRYLTAYFTKSTSQIIDAIWSYKVTPNPASDFVYIEFDKPISKFSISITSLDGRKIAQYFDQTKIPVENLPRGTYFLELKSEDLVKVEKLVLK